MSELNWSIIWMLVVIMITSTICIVVIMAMLDQRKDSAHKRKIAEHQALGGGEGVGTRMD